MKEPADHEVRLWLKGSQYIALRHLADLDERGLSAYVRRLVEQHLDTVSAAMAAEDSGGCGSGAGPEDGRG
jgi:hypothetical protein